MTKVSSHIPTQYEENDTKYIYLYLEKHVKV